KAIEKAVLESDLGLTPSNDGKLIRLPIPQLTEERRKELVKVVRNMAEDHRVAVREIRRDAMRHLKELVDNGEVGADDEHRAEGHRAGSRALRPVVEAAIDLGIESLVVYAFSTENWSRDAGEVGALMEIFGETIDRELEDLAAQGVRCRFVGRRDRAPDWLRAKMDQLETATADRSRLQLWIAFDYGGRAELVDAARRLLESGIDPDDVDE